MALQLSTGLRNFLLGQGSFREAFADSILKIYSGSSPAASGSYGAADVAPSGSLLCTLSRASGTVTAVDESMPQMAKITCAGTSAGNYALVITGASGAAVTYSVVYAVSAIATTLALVQLINRTCPDFMATVDHDAVIFFMVGRSPANVGALYTITDASTGGNAAAVTSADLQHFAASDACQFGLVASGAIAKQSAAWSGVGIVTATAGYWRLVRASEFSTESQSLTAIRLQGTCGVGSGDILMSTTAIVAAASQTVDSFSIELPAAI